MVIYSLKFTLKTRVQQTDAVEKELHTLVKGLAESKGGRG
jgi:hypothetical protein